MKTAEVILYIQVFIDVVFIKSISDFDLGKPSIEKTRNNLEIFQIGEGGGVRRSTFPENNR